MAQIGRKEEWKLGSQERGQHLGALGTMSLYTSESGRKAWAGPDRPDRASALAHELGASLR